MKASEWIQTLPETPGPEREQAIYKAVVDGFSIVTFTPLEITAGEDVLVLNVAMDALRIGESGDSVRVACDALTATCIADHLGCVLSTAKISDLVWQAVQSGSGVLLSPQTQNPDGEMAYTSRFVEESYSIDEVRAGRCGLLCTTGKLFVLCKAIFGSGEGKAANYGWHVSGGSRFSGVLPGVQVLQPLATAHVDTFTDYSQLLNGLVKRVCYLNGEEQDLADVLTSDALAPLVSHEGALPGFRYPRADTHGPVDPIPETDPSPSPEPDPDPEPDPWRNPLKKGMKGSDVMDLQGDLMSLGYDLSPYGADGDFGGLTDRRVREFQAAAKLTVDGIVGPATRAALDDAETPVVPPGPAPPAPTGKLDLGLRYVPAANYTWSNRTALRVVVIHTMEAPENYGTAAAVASWFHGPDPEPPAASAHLCIDAGEAIETCKPEFIAWAAPGCNSDGYQVEHAGYASQGAEAWDDDYSQKMLRLSAGVVAKVAAFYQVPLKKLSVEELKAGARGFVGHVDVSNAYHKSTHVDPGGDFPWDRYLELVREAQVE